MNTLVKKLPWWGWAAGVLLLLVLSCCSCGLVSAIESGHTAASATPTPALIAHVQAKAQVTSVPTPVPTATPDQSAEVSTYGTTVLGGLDTLENDTTAISADCGAQDMASCREDLVLFQQDTQSLQTALNNLPVPSCLASTNADLENALTYYSSGAGQMISAIDTDNPSLLSAGLNTLSQGDTVMLAVSTDLSNASCD